MLQHEGHRGQFVAEGKAEVAPQHPVGPTVPEEEAVVLNVEGLIKAHHLAELVEVLLRGVDRHQQRRRVPSQIQHEEDDEEDDLHDDDGLQASPHDIDAHLLASVDRGSLVVDSWKC